MSDNNIRATLASIIPQLNWYGGKHIPALLVGAPGTAKTTFLKGLQAEYTAFLRSKGMIGADEEYGLALYALPQTGPDALEGISVPSDDRTVLNRLPLKALRDVDNSKFAMIFGDELTSCSLETGAAFMTLAQDLTAGDLTLHSRVSPMFACNDPEQAAAGRELTPPEANRFVWIDWRLNSMDFFDYLAGGKGVLRNVKFIPKDWEEKFVPRTKLLVKSFLETHQTLINQLDGAVDGSTTTVDNKQVDASRAWASQRSWTNCARLLGAILSIGEEVHGAMARIAVEGTVGEFVAEQFISWLRTANLPSPEEVLKDRDKGFEMVMAIGREDHRKALLEQIALYAEQGMDSGGVDTWGNAWHIILKVTEKNKDLGFGAQEIISRSIARSRTSAKYLELLGKMRESGEYDPSAFVYNIRQDLEMDKRGA